jgi:hypothetical protein
LGHALDFTGSTDAPGSVELRQFQGIKKKWSPDLGNQKNDCYFTLRPFLLFSQHFLLCFVVFGFVLFGLLCIAA